MAAAHDSTEVTFSDSVEYVAPVLLPIGSVIGGKYAIRRVLGMGGNGAVYEGEHTAVGHRAAIKVAHSSPENRQEIMARFMREARICGTLRHPHVGQVYDAGTLEDGSPYMVMELHEGRSLAEVLDETKLPVAAIIDISRQLLAGLGAAHQAGFVHRDVKPENVMIVRDQGGEVVVKLVDFGISKKVGGQHDDPTLTRDDAIVGTPDFMAPEQLRGDAVDSRTDLYAVGVLMYECLTHRTPFTGETVADLIVAVLRDPIRPPTELRADCPPVLETIVLEAMSRDPANRFESAGEMSRALEHVRMTTRTAPGTNLARLSERPPSARPLPHAGRRRTVDSKTLQNIRAKEVLELASYSRTRLRIVLTALGVLAIGTASYVVLSASSTAPTPMPVVTANIRDTQLASTVATPAPAAANVPTPRPAQAPASAPATAEEAVMPAAPTSIGREERAPASQRSSLHDVAARKRVARANVVAPGRLEAPPEPPAPTPSVDPAAEQAQLRQAATAVALGQNAQARAVYRELVRANPRQAAAWRGLGVAASQLGESAEAARAFRRYLALQPTASDAARVREQLAKLEAGGTR